MTNNQASDLYTAVFNLTNDSGVGGPLRPELWVSPTFAGVIERIVLHGDDSVTALTSDGRRAELGVQAYPVVKALKSVDVVSIVRKDSEGRAAGRYEAGREFRRAIGPLPLAQQKRRKRLLG